MWSSRSARTARATVFPTVVSNSAARRLSSGSLRFSVLTAHSDTRYAIDVHASVADFAFRTTALNANHTRVPRKTETPTNAGAASEDRSRVRHASGSSDSCRGLRRAKDWTVHSVSAITLVSYGGSPAASPSFRSVTCGLGRTRSLRRWSPSQSTPLGSSAPRSNGS